MTFIRSAVLLIALATALPLFAEGRIQILTVQSKALAGNLAGDPAEQKFAVYTPQGYETGTVSPILTTRGSGRSTSDR
jgi:hypothetical protein